MKPVVIGVVGGGVAVAIVVAVLVTQSMTTMAIQEDLQRQQVLEMNLERCDLNLLGLTLVGREETTQWENCYESAIMRYGNDEQKADWNLNKNSYIADLKSVYEPNNDDCSLEFEGDPESYSAWMRYGERLERCQQKFEENNPQFRDWRIFEENVMDCSKGLDYYADRYHNEPSYKTWFDENYPYLDIDGLSSWIENSCDGFYGLVKNSETRTYLTFEDSTLEEMSMIYNACLNGDFTYGTHCDNLLSKMLFTYCDDTYGDADFNMCQNRNNNEIKNMVKP